MNKNKMMNKREMPCEVCGGSGQISYFKGVSRFLLSWEDCPECNGMGFKLAQDEAVELETTGTGREEQIIKLETQAAMEEKKCAPS